MAINVVPSAVTQNDGAWHDLGREEESSCTCASTRNRNDRRRRRRVPRPSEANCTHDEAKVILELYQRYNSAFARKVNRVSSGTVGPRAICQN